MANTPTHGAHHHGVGHAERLEVVHTWVSTGRSELITHLHLPAAGTARGVVVLTEGLMREQITGFRTTYLLADELARRGLLAVRFGWSGTSDSSAPAPDDDRPVVERWLHDLGHMATLAGQLVPGAPLTLFAMRGAAVLTAEHARRNPGTVDQLLWWEPVGSTRVWLRGQETLHKLASEFGERQIVPPLPAGCVEVPGHLFSAADAASLRGLAMSDVGGARVDAVMRPDLSMDKALRAVLDSAATVTRLEGQAETLDISTIMAVVSRPTVDALADAAQHVALEKALPVTLPELRHTATVDHVMTRGRIAPVVEHIVDVDGLHGIVTEAVGEATRAVMSLPGSSDPMAGPTFLWTQLNRRLAGHAVTSLRVDRCRIGEHIDPGDLANPWPYCGSAVDDAEIAYRWFSKRTGMLATLYGMCSGAWIAAQLATRTTVPTIIAVNMVAWDLQALPEGNPLPSNPTPLTVGEGIVTYPGTLIGQLKNTLRAQLKDHTPYPVWRELAWRGKVQMPLPLLDRATAGGTVIHQVLCSSDATYVEGQMLTPALRELTLRGRQLTVLRRLALDHSMLSHSSRSQTVHDVMVMVNRTPSCRKDRP